MSAVLRTKLVEKIQEGLMDSMLTITFGLASSHDFDGSTSNRPIG